MKSIFEKINDGDPTGRAILITIQDCKRLCREGVQRGYEAGFEAGFASHESQAEEVNQSDSCLHAEATDKAESERKKQAIRLILNGPKRKAKSK